MPPSSFKMTRIRNMDCYCTILLFSFCVLLNVQNSRSDIKASLSREQKEALNLVSVFYRLIKCSPEHFMRSSCTSIRPSVPFHGKSWTRQRRIMKLGTIILEVTSSSKMGHVSCTWPLTRSNWRCVLVNTCIYVLLQFIFAFKLHTSNSTVNCNITFFQKKNY